MFCLISKKLTKNKMLTKGNIFKSFAKNNYKLHSCVWVLSKPNEKPY